MAALLLIENAWMLLKDDKIADYGPMANCPQADAEIIDAGGRFVLPCYVDAHTHLVFAGSREKEFEMRIAGTTYEEIARAGGGILNSARRLQ
ncbi:MAG: imidazolonepropionase, partial [Bacteroidota bacterium]|nr:imidazolonepropionase [Bacteroidota bacterium]